MSVPSHPRVQIRLHGESLCVPFACVDDRTVIAVGRFLRTARVMDEELVEGDTVPDPAVFVTRLRRARLGADIFTFAQKFPDVSVRHPYRRQWDDLAAITLVSVEDWWDNRITYDARKAVKRARRMGVVVRTARFDDDLAEGIRRIYDESPVRQGRAFWHYGKEFEAVKAEAGTYLDRSTFIGAYHGDELIGFIKMVQVGTVASTLHVISQKKHFDKKPTNALIAAAVEICAARGLSHLVYGSYEPGTSLTEFKRRNGFEHVQVPRYYVPLTLRGHLALRGGLHGGLTALLPSRLRATLRQLRAHVYSHGRVPA